MADARRLAYPGELMTDEVTPEDVDIIEYDADPPPEGARGEIEDPLALVPEDFPEE